MRKELIKIFKTKNFVGDSFILKDEDIILNSIRIYKNNDCTVKEYVCFYVQVGGENEYRIIISNIPGTYIIAYECIMEGYKMDIHSDDLPNYKNKDGNYNIFFDEKLNVIESKGNDKI